MYEHIHTHKPTHLDCLHMAECISGSGQEGQERPYYYCQWERERTSQNTITGRRSWTCKITVYTSLIPRHLALLTLVPQACITSSWHYYLTLVLQACITSSWHHYLTLVPQACPRGKGSSLREAKQGWGVECGQWWRGGRGRREVHGRLYQEDCRGGVCVCVHVCMYVYLCVCECVQLCACLCECVQLCAYLCVCVCLCVGVQYFPILLQLATGARDTDINPDKEKTDEVFSSPSRPERISFRPMRFVGLCVLRVGRGGCGVLLLNTRRWWTTGWTWRPASWRWGGLTDHFPASLLIDRYWSKYNWLKQNYCILHSSPSLYCAPFGCPAQEQLEAFVEHLPRSQDYRMQLQSAVHWPKPFRPCYTLREEHREKLLPQLPAMRETGSSSIAIRSAPEGS